MSQYNDTVELIKRMVEHDFFYLDRVLIVKKTPHTQPVNIWAVAVNPSGALFIMDAQEEWHQVFPEQAEAIGSIYQRIKLMTEAFESKPLTNKK